MIVPSPSTKKLLEDSTQAYEKQLLDADEALTYLEERGITSEALEHFRIGFVANPISTEHDDYRGRLVFPYITPTGVVSLRFRRLGDKPVNKFLGISGDISRMYNTPALIGATSIYICEGETDTIACWQAGLSAVGFPGATQAQKLPQVWSRIFANRSVTILADNDDTKILPDGTEKRPGREFAETLRSIIPGARIVMLPKGYDVSQFYLEKGAQALEAYATGSS